MAMDVVLDPLGKMLAGAIDARKMPWTNRSEMGMTAFRPGASMCNIICAGTGAFIMQVNMFWVCREGIHVYLLAARNPRSLPVTASYFL